MGARLPWSLCRISASLEAAKNWCHANAAADWLGPLYQFANRIAHLYFIREKRKRPSWLVNLYFLNDPIGPADREMWEAEHQCIMEALGLRESVPSCLNLYLPALHSFQVSRS
jgi:hypothetical protein